MLPHVSGPVERNPVANERKQGRPEWRTDNNPAAIATRDGRIHLLFCIEYMRVFYTRSDDGRTFAAPVEITAALEPLRRAGSIPGASSPPDPAMASNCAGDAW
jgi:sialidase-1